MSDLKVKLKSFERYFPIIGFILSHILRNKKSFVRKRQKEKRANYRPPLFIVIQSAVQGGRSRHPFSCKPRRSHLFSHRGT